MKNSIIEKFASDAINAPATVTGGGGKCGGKSGGSNKKSGGSKNKSGGSKNKSGSSKSGGGKCPPPPCW